MSEWNNNQHDWEQSSRGGGWDNARSNKGGRGRGRARGSTEDRNGWNEFAASNTNRTRSNPREGRGGGGRGYRQNNSQQSSESGWRQQGPSAGTNNTTAWGQKNPSNGSWGNENSKDASSAWGAPPPPSQHESNSSWAGNYSDSGENSSSTYGAVARASDNANTSSINKKSNNDSSSGWAQIQVEMFGVVLVALLQLVMAVVTNGIHNHLRKIVDRVLLELSVLANGFRLNL
ncbi:hypothetical protein BDC45DRAFT_28076 [Circinella umbellata]|nr:hypothetical protein BDC45DRAFT_28076 [Circinella umbellata]